MHAHLFMHTYVHSFSHSFGQSFILFQVIACEQEVGWRERVDNRGTRVVLFMTDNDFHYAGEGRVSVGVWNMGVAKLYGEI